MDTEELIEVLQTEPQHLQVYVKVGRSFWAIQDVAHIPAGEASDEDDLPYPGAVVIYITDGVIEPQ